MKKSYYIGIIAAAAVVVLGLIWWIVWSRPVIAPANEALVAENAALREKLAARERAYFECRDQLAQLRLTLGGAMDSGRLETSPHREEQLLALLKAISERIEAMEKLRQEVADAETAKKAWDELLMLIRNPGAATSSTCRILAVDPQSGLVVLSAGTVHGVFPGLLYNLEDSDTQLRVIECRPWVSGATLYRGDPATIAPGKNCRIDETPVSSNRILP